ncbi:hypothetical protein TI39_contig594g00030 [Zymoseptoria brevis]|uniref:Uncharacterized protein n=1 Tax=Zymoseptoria brevis TaxID=1047168 RepID=A0A0F4GHP0_9PEZI|nr:hypothetical protein TI39_contig594g00030 [Zymoseptoria brevis]
MSYPKIESSFAGRNRSGSKSGSGLEQMKSSLRMTPIAAKGESVDQAISRVSGLKRPERPKVDELEYESERTKKKKEVTPMMVATEQLENVSPTDTAVGSKSPLIPTRTASSSSQIPRPATRHRRSDAISLSDGEQPQFNFISSANGADMDSTSEVSSRGKERAATEQSATSTTTDRDERHDSGDFASDLTARLASIRTKGIKKKPGGPLPAGLTTTKTDTVVKDDSVPRSLPSGWIRGLVQDVAQEEQIPPRSPRPARSALFGPSSLASADMEALGAFIASRGNVTYSSRPPIPLAGPREQPPSKRKRVSFSTGKDAGVPPVPPAAHIVPSTPKLSSTGFGAEFPKLTKPTSHVLPLSPAVASEKPSDDSAAPVEMKRTRSKSRGRKEERKEEEVMADHPVILYYANTHRYVFPSLDASLSELAPVVFLQPTTDVAEIEQRLQEFVIRSRESLSAFGELRLTPAQEEERKARLQRRLEGLTEVQAGTEGILAVAPGGSSVLLTKKGQQQGGELVAQMYEEKQHREQQSKDRYRDYREDIKKAIIEETNSDPAEKDEDVKEEYHDSEAHLIPLSAYRDRSPTKIPQPQLERLTSSQAPASTTLEGFVPVSSFYRPSSSIFDLILGTEHDSDNQNKPTKTPDTDSASWVEDTASSASNDTAAGPSSIAEEDAKSDDSNIANPATSPSIERAEGADLGALPERGSR